MKKQPKNRFDPQRNQKVGKSAAMTSLSESVPDAPLQVGQAQAAPNLDQSKVDYGTTQFGRGANQVGDNPSAQLANAFNTLAQTAVSVVDTAHKFQEFKDSEVDAARQEEIREWTLQNPNADEATKIKQAAAINARYESQYGLVTSKRSLDVENFKLSASLPGAQYKDFERDYVYKRGLILTDSEMTETEKAEELKKLNDSFLDTGIKQFGDNEEHASAIYRTVVEGRNENQERITRTVRKNLRKMSPRINEVIEEVIVEIGDGLHTPMNRSQLAKLVSERAGVPEDMQTELFLEQFNLYYKEKIDDHYKNVDQAFKKRVDEANQIEQAMTLAHLNNADTITPDLTGDAYAAIAAEVVDAGAEQRQNAFNNAVKTMAKQYATKYFKGEADAEKAWRDEAKAVADQFGLDPDGPLVESALKSAKEGLGALGFSAAERAMGDMQINGLYEAAITAFDPGERWAAQTLAIEDVLNASIANAVGNGVTHLAQHSAFRDMDSGTLTNIATDAGNIITQARLSYAQDPSQDYPAHLSRVLEGQSEQVRIAAGIMSSADPFSEAFLDALTRDLKTLRKGEVLDVERVKQVRATATGMGIVPGDDGKLTYPSLPAEKKAEEKSRVTNGANWAYASKAEGKDIPDFDATFTVQAADVEKLGRLMLSDPEVMNFLISSSEYQNPEDKAKFILAKMSQAMGHQNGFSTADSPEMLAAVRFLRDELFNSELLTKLQREQQKAQPDAAVVGRLVAELNQKSEGVWEGLARLATNGKIDQTSTGSIMMADNNTVNTGEVLQPNDALFFAEFKRAKNSPSIREFMLMQPDLRSPAEIVAAAKSYGFTYTPTTNSKGIINLAPALNERQEPVVAIGGVHNEGGRAVKLSSEFRRDLVNEKNALDAALASTADGDPNELLEQMSAFYDVLLEDNPSSADLAKFHDIYPMVKRRVSDDENGPRHQIDGRRLATVQAILTDKSFFATLTEKFPTTGERNRAIALISQSTKLVDGRYVAMIPEGVASAMGMEKGEGKEFELGTFGRNYGAGEIGPYRPDYVPPQHPVNGFYPVTGPAFLFPSEARVGEKVKTPEEQRKDNEARIALELGG